MNPSEQSAHVLSGLVEPVNRYFHVPIAARIVRPLIQTPVTPNQVTCLGVLFGLGSAFAFSRGTLPGMVLGGVLLEVTLILDCVDGQLARARNCASDWGRLVDGIGGYIAYLAVVIGIMAGLKSYYGTLGFIAVLTILKAITYDYIKLQMTTRVQKGYDGTQKEILNTWEKIQAGSSPILTLYYYYLQFQQLLFEGRWVSLKDFTAHQQRSASQALMTQQQREDYHLKAKTLMTLWRWNGLDLVLFLISLFAILGILEACLIPMAWLMGAQYLLTLIFHHRFLRHEAPA